MNSLTFILVVLIHWIADFVIQTDEQAKNKSSNIFYLIEHTSMYSCVWIILLVLLSCTGVLVISAGKILIFGVITFLAHTVTDYFTSRLNSKLWAKGDVHNFFVSIGFDQVLHYVQLILTIKYLL